MHSIKDIKHEIVEQHRQLAANRSELNLLRWELTQTLRQALVSKGVLAGSFAAGLLLGWWNRTRLAHPRPEGARKESRGHWIAPVKSLLWKGLIRFVASFTTDRIAGGELREHYD